MRLQNRIALVTGAGSGIGAATARAFGREGARLLLADINGQAVREVAEDLRAQGVQAEWIAADLGREGEAERLPERAFELFGRLDILFNCAGVAVIKHCTETTREDFANMLSVNLIGAFFCAQSAARLMERQRYGRIINVSSITGQRGSVGRAAYGASKGALEALMHTMSTELAGNGITVNNIAPGPIVTPMAEARLDAAQRNAYIHAIPQRRLGRPENVAEAAVFLASDAASYISGHTLNVDGGYRTAGLTFSLGTTRAPEVSDFEIS